MFKKFSVVVLVVALATCISGQLVMADEVWEHYVFTDRDTFGFENQQTGQAVFYGTHEYGQIAKLWLPPSLQNSRGQVTYQDGLYYFSVPGQLGSDLFWHAGMKMWKSATSR